MKFNILGTSPPVVLAAICSAADNNNTPHRATTLPNISDSFQALFPHPLNFIAPDLPQETLLDVINFFFISFFA